jgi:hypothetical protein
MRQIAKITLRKKACRNYANCMGWFVRGAHNATNNLTIKKDVITLRSKKNGVISLDRFSIR